MTRKIIALILLVAVWGTQSLTAVSQNNDTDHTPEQILEKLEELQEARKGFNENRKAGYKHGYEDGYSKAIDEAIEKFLEYGCVCVEWNRGLSKEKLVDDVLRQVMGQVVITLEKMK